MLDSLEADSDIASSEQYREQAREFVKKVVVAHANSEHVTSEESLDHGAACVLAARMWTYGIGQLQKQAQHMGVDPLQILKVIAEGNQEPGLEDLDARESLQALIILRLVKKPPTLAERHLLDTIEGVGCTRPACKHSVTGVPCVGGCKWDEAGKGVLTTARHQGLVALRELALEWDVPAHDIFDAVEIPRVVDQKTQLVALILHRARQLDFKRPEEPEKEHEGSSVPKDSDELKAVQELQERLFEEGKMKAEGQLPSRCCARVCGKLPGLRACVSSPSIQILRSVEGTVLEWCVRGAQMWISIIVYICTRLLARRYRQPEDIEYFPQMEQPHIIGGFLSFFLVFYACV